MSLFSVLNAVKGDALEHTTTIFITVIIKNSNFIKRLLRFREI